MFSVLTPPKIQIKGAASLAGAALGNMFVNCAGLAIGVGLSTAMDTLISKSFGAKQMDKIGQITLRASLILSLAAIPVGFLW